MQSDELARRSGSRPAPTGPSAPPPPLSALEGRGGEGRGEGEGKGGGKGRQPQRKVNPVLLCVAYRLLIYETLARHTNQKGFACHLIPLIPVRF